MLHEVLAHSEGLFVGRTGIGVEGSMLVLWLCAMLELLYDVMEEDKNVPMHHSIVTEIIPITLVTYRDIAMSLRIYRLKIESGLHTCSSNNGRRMLARRRREPTTVRVRLRAPKRESRWLPSFLQEMSSRAA